MGKTSDSIYNSIGRFVDRTYGLIFVLAGALGLMSAQIDEDALKREYLAKHEQITPVLIAESKDCAKERRSHGPFSIGLDLAMFTIGVVRYATRKREQ